MPHSGELTPGVLVTPSIRLERLLGRGGMGSVWLAQHLQLRTQVVVKFMTAERAQSPEAQQRFRREAELAAQAKSPHVVQIFDHGISQLGIPYIAMELLEGEDLGKRIAREGPVEPRRFADWLSQACRGLARAHAKGIVHRDIKPENIFLCDNDGEVLVKVLDFGVAKGAFDPSEFLSTQTGAMLGTAYYMSPEQTMGKKDLDHRTDLWALAVVTFYALTGVRPFSGDGIGPLVLSITTDPLPLLSERMPALGGELDAWMLKALARAREERFQSAKELAEAFASAIAAPERGSGPRDATAWPPAAPPPPVGDGGMAASTMASVSSENQSARRAVSAWSAARGFPLWAAPIGVGALLGLVGVLAFSGSNRAPQAPPRAASPAVPSPVPVALVAGASATQSPLAPDTASSTPVPSATLAAAPTKTHPSPARLAPTSSATTALRAPSTPVSAPAKAPPAAIPPNPLDMKIE